MAAPKPKFENSDEDFQSASNDIEELYKKFIAPIESIRSYAQVNRSSQGQTQQNIQGLLLVQLFGEDVDLDPAHPLESRCHAFYRMIGLPVVAPDFSFYSPGFDGNTSVKTKESVIQKVLADSSYLTYVHKKESVPVSHRNLFSKQNFSSALFAKLVMQGDFKFNSLGEDGSGVIDNHPQTFSSEIRSAVYEQLPNFYKEQMDDVQELIAQAVDDFGLTGVSAGIKGIDGFHFLHPFVVDPRIENTVMPENNRISAPFLPTKNSTQISKDVFLKRPGIELIVRERLRSALDGSQLYETLQNTLTNTKKSSTFVEDIDVNSVLSVIRTLTDPTRSNKEFLQDADFDELGKQISAPVQLKNGSELIRLIRSVLAVYIKNCTEIANAQSKINFFPIPSAEGFENKDLGAKITVPDLVSASAIERKMQELRARVVLATYQSTSTQDLGDFASPFQVQTTADSIAPLGKELQALTQERDKVAQRAFQALRENEIITGETMGLGLVDILAIYAALWIMKLPDLLGLLDQESLNRLIKFNPELVNAEVQAAQNVSRVKESLTGFHQTLYNILTYADSFCSYLNGTSE